MRTVSVSCISFAGALLLAQSALAQDGAPPPPTVVPVSAQTVPENGVISYPTAFFDSFRPSNVLEMIARVPGFSYAAGDAVRGFAGAAGNVLIDGERPSAKSVTLDDALKRIAPQSVERLDLIRGGAAGIDMQGQPVVVNVVRKDAVDSTLAVEGSARLYFYDGGQTAGTTRLEGSRRTARTTLELALSTSAQPGQMEHGDGIVTRYTGNGALVQAGNISARAYTRVYAGSGAGEYRGSRDTYRVSAGYKHDESGRGETSDLRDAAGLAFVDKANNRTNTNTAEIGADYQSRISNALTARVVGLFTHVDDFLMFDTRAARSPRQISIKETAGAEAIARGSLTWLHRSGLTAEAGGETAFNYLDSASSLTNGGAAVVLPSANVRIEERRSEGFVSTDFKPNARTSLEAGLRVETSTITQSGDVAQSRAFTFAKPRLVMTFAPRPSTQIRLHYERVVGQLKFEDFAAAADLTSGAVNAGNANLEPERAWLSEVVLEQRFWGRGALVLTVTHRDIQQVVDVIPVRGPSGVFSAPGNIGSGKRNDVKASLTLPTDRLGIKGGQLRANLTHRDSHVVDPVTGVTRPISLVRVLEGDLNYTQDIPRWNSTFTLESSAFGIKDRSYRLGEISTLTDMPVVKATWAYHPRPDLLVALSVENLAQKERQRRRAIYAGGTRASGVIATYDYRSTQILPWIALRLRKTF